MNRPFVILVAMAFSAATGAAEPSSSSSAMLTPAVDVIGSPRPNDPRPPGPSRPDLRGNPAGQPTLPGQQPSPPRPPAAARGVQPPALLGNCDAGGCWDSQGERYHGTGDGSRFLNGDGRLCTAHGKFITCQ